MNKSLTIWLILIFAILSTGCSSIIKAEQPAVVESLTLDDSLSLGQTFYARFNGMDGIEIYLEPRESGNGYLQLHLREDAQTLENLAVVSLPIAEISAPGFYRFQIPVQADSNQQNYYLLLKTKGAGSVEVGSAPGDTYPDGALYQGHHPKDHLQMAFKLSYYTPRLGLGVLVEMLTWVWYLLVAAFLLVLPGWALLALAFSQGKHAFHAWHWALKLTLSVGVSLAVYPVLMLLTHAINLQMGVLYAWLPPILGLIFLVWRGRKQRISSSFKVKDWKLDWCDLTLIVIALLIFATRFWIIRTIEIPLWGDSYQHAMISQLMLDNNGLFSSWQPYTPYTSLTTHFGFSTSTALLSWITGMSGTHAALWMGQIINGFAILTLYPIAVKFSKGNRWAGVGALLVGGLISTYPAFYLNWGRYAQLAGQAVLPVALWLLWEALDQEQWSLRKEWPRLLLAGLVLTGMILSYYRMPFWYATFVLVLLLFWGVPTYKFQFRKWAHGIIRLFLMGGFGIVFFLPWVGNLMGSNLVSAVEAGVTTGAASSGILKSLETLKQIDTYIPQLLLIIIGITIVLAIIKRNWMVMALPVWFVLLLGYRTGAIIKLPGANMLQVFAIMISVYIPVSLILGWFFGQVMHAIEKPKPRAIIVAASILTILIGTWFGWQQRLILDRSRFELVSPTDQKAFSWIQTQTPAEARFLIQGFQYLNTAAGSDAGWWLPLLANRENTIPPQYAQFNEASQPPDYTERVVELYASLGEISINSPEGIHLLCDWGITHIYQGQSQGSVGGQPLYHPREMRTEPGLFTQIYHQDRVSIFTLNPEACSSQP